MTKCPTSRVRQLYNAEMSGGAAILGVAKFSAARDKFSTKRSLDTVTSVLAQPARFPAGLWTTPAPASPKTPTSLQQTVLVSDSRQQSKASQEQS